MCRKKLLAHVRKTGNNHGVADILDVVRKDIKGKRGRLTLVAARSGVPVSTLHEIVHGKSDPRKKTVDKLLRHYRRSA